jgi:hypothetical protein
VEKVKIRLSWCIPTMILITVALIAPVAAHAGSEQIWPDQLKLAYPNPESYQSPLYVLNGIFEAVLDLPTKAKITKITYYHIGQNSPRTQLCISRIKMGEDFELLQCGHSTDATGEVIAVEIVPTDLVITKGYRYSIELVSSNSDSRVTGIVIDYAK